MRLRAAITKTGRTAQEFASQSSLHPADAFWRPAQHGERGAATLRPAAALHSRSRGTQRGLLRESEPFSGLIENTRLAHEVAVIHSYAHHIVTLLQVRDPLSERVHLNKAQFALYGLGAVLLNSLRRIGRPRPARKPQDAQRNA